MYTGDPINNPIDALRLQVGDTDNAEVWLTDNDYLYYISLHPSNVRQQALAASQAILFKLARRTRERAGQIEVYSGDAYTNYADALVRLVKDPSFTAINPISYFGGIIAVDFANQKYNTDLIESTFQKTDDEGCCESWRVR
jgi:hypothetical protein